MRPRAKGSRQLESERIKNDTKNKRTTLNKADINKIFKLSTDKQDVICPPEQVFVKSGFDYLLTISGDLVDDEAEYEKFKAVLSSIGETEFFICENLGATITDRNEPFKTTVSLQDDYNIFQEKVSAFEPPFGWVINHFFVYGKNESWGIYISEFPRINIIGSDKTFTDEFRRAFSIIGNGYADLKDFIELEFKSNPDQLEKFITNYNLRGGS